MDLEIGTYEFNENPNEKCVVYAVYKSILTHKWNTILARRSDTMFEFTTVFKNEYNIPEKYFYKDLLGYLSFNNRREMKYMKYDDSDTVFDEENFKKNYNEVIVVSDEKRIKIGEKYRNEEGEYIYTLGVVRTDLDEDNHTVIIRKSIKNSYNKYIDYDHDQFGLTPDYYNCLFIDRKIFHQYYSIV